MKMSLTPLIEEPRHSLQQVVIGFLGRSLITILHFEFSLEKKRGFNSGARPLHLLRRTRWIRFTV